VHALPSAPVELGCYAWDGAAGCVPFTTIAFPDRCKTYRFVSSAGRRVTARGRQALTGSSLFPV
jgi:hypothetical protein